MFAVNIEKVSLANKNYRKVLYTDERQQLVVMSLGVGMDIEMEQHDGDQFIRVEKGTGMAKSFVDGKVARSVRLSDGVSVIVPKGTWHYIKNTGKQPLKLYTIYSPPQHRPGLVEKNKNE